MVKSAVIWWQRRRRKRRSSSSAATINVFFMGTCEINDKLLTDKIYRMFPNQMFFRLCCFHERSNWTFVKLCTKRLSEGFYCFTIYTMKYCGGVLPLKSNCLIGTCIEWMLVWLMIYLLSLFCLISLDRLQSCALFLAVVLWWRSSWTRHRRSGWGSEKMVENFL